VTDSARGNGSNDASGARRPSDAGVSMTRIGGRAAVVLGVLALTNVFAYAARNGLFTVYPDLRARFDLRDAKLGLLTTAFIIPHALATLPFGWAGDRFDRRRVIAFGMAIAGVAGALGALATTTTELVISRAFVGFGTAAVVPIANTILGQLFEGSRKASRMAFFNLGVLFGGVVGLGAGQIVGFPAVVVVLAIPGVVLGLGVLALPVPPYRAPHAPVPIGLYFAELGTQFIADGRALLRSRTLRWLIASTVFMAFAAGGFNAWLIEFLEHDKGMSKSAATSLLMVAMCGAVAGILAGGRIADRLRRRTPAGRLWTIALGMALTAPCTAACIVLPPGPTLYVASVATMFFISWYHAPMAVSVDDLAPPARSVAAQGLVIGVMHLLGTAPSSYVVGAISDRASLYAAMWVPTGGLVVAAACMALATPSFAADSRAARAGEPAPGSL
jgi:MFS family permease